MPQARLNTGQTILCPTPKSTIRVWNYHWTATGSASVNFKSLNPDGITVDSQYTDSCGTSGGGINAANSDNTPKFDCATGDSLVITVSGSPDGILDYTIINPAGFS